MSTYRVYLEMRVSTSVDVEAGSPEEAIVLVDDAPGMPGFGFGGAGVDSAGEWTPLSVSDEHGVEVWSEKGTD